MPLLSRRRFPVRRRPARAAASGCCNCSRATACWRRKGRAPFRPAIDPARPCAARPPQFPAKAEQLLIIYCAGAVSHVDSWDYKPELFRQDGRDPPDAPAGHVHGPGRQAGQAALGVQAARTVRQDDLGPVSRSSPSWPTTSASFIRSPRGTARTPRRRTFSPPASRSRAIPVSAPGRTTRWAARTRTCRRSSPSPTRAAARRPGPTTGAPASCRRRFKARASTPASRRAICAPPASDRPVERRRRPRPAGPAQRRAPGSLPGRHAARRPHRQLRAGRPDASVHSVAARLSRRNRRTSLPTTAPIRRTRSRPPMPATACSPGGCSSAACASCSFSTAAANNGGQTNWDNHTRPCARSTACTRRSSTSRPPRCSATCGSAACSSGRWSSGAPSSAACPSCKPTAPAAITTSKASPAG